MSLGELNETEAIKAAGDIAGSLANVTAPTESPIFAADIDLAVNIVSSLNKYDNHFMWLVASRYILCCSVTETVVANLTVDDTFFDVRSTHTLGNELFLHSYVYMANSVCLATCIRAQNKYLKLVSPLLEIVKLLQTVNHSLHWKSTLNLLFQIWPYNEMDQNMVVNVTDYCFELCVYA